MSYVPTQVPAQPELLAEYLRRELDVLAAALTGAQDSLTLTKTYVAPIKPVDGMIVYADGTLFNPGAGNGIYRWNQDLVSWILLG